MEMLHSRLVRARVDPFAILSMSKCVESEKRFSSAADSLSVGCRPTSDGFAGPRMAAAPLIANLLYGCRVNILLLVKIIHYAIYALLAIGAIGYMILKPPFVDPMSDPEAAEAMALVQTHRAQQAPTIRQAITDRVKGLSEKGQGVKLQEWRVEREPPNNYLVRVSIREQVTVEWFERNYLWRVDVAKRTITPLTIPASTVMPSNERDKDAM